MTVNISGANVVFDGGNPRIWTATAKANMSAGTLVRVDGATGVVTYNPEGFRPSDLVVAPIANSKQCNGITIHDVTSGAKVSIAQRGAWLMRTNAVVSGGDLVMAVSGTNQAVKTWGIGSATVSDINAAPIGRALGNSASGTNLYNLISLNI